MNGILNKGSYREHLMENRIFRIRFTKGVMLVSKSLH